MFNRIGITIKIEGKKNMYKGNIVRFPVEGVVDKVELVCNILEEMESFSQREVKLGAQNKYDTPEFAVNAEAMASFTKLIFYHSDLYSTSLSSVVNGQRYEKLTEVLDDYFIQNISLNDTLNSIFKIIPGTIK